MNNTQKTKAIRTAAEIMLVACNVMEIFSEPDWRIIKIQSSCVCKEEIAKDHFNEWNKYIFSEIKKLSVNDKVEAPY